MKESLLKNVVHILLRIRDLIDFPKGLIGFRIVP